MTGTAQQFLERARAYQEAAEFLHQLAKENPDRADELVRVAQWNARRGFWWKRKIHQAEAGKKAQP